jgi:hypothetical protein
MFLFFLFFLYFCRSSDLVDGMERSVPAEDRPAAALEALLRADIAI